jgi:oligopeptidase B
MRSKRKAAAKDYPAIPAMGGLTDPRVAYWEPAKWIARLRATMTGGSPVLLRTNMGAGHGGASGRFERLDEVAIAYGFALWAVGWRRRVRREYVSRTRRSVLHDAPQSRDP